MEVGREPTIGEVLRVLIDTAAAESAQRPNRNSASRERAQERARRSRTSFKAQPALSVVGTRAPSSRGAGDSVRMVAIGGVVTPALDEAGQIRRVYEREAGNYDRNVKLPERLLFAGGREWVCARAEGEVLEIAVGTGLNLPHYPDGVRRILAVIATVVVRSPRSAF